MSVDVLLEVNTETEGEETLEESAGEGEIFLSGDTPAPIDDVAEVAAQRTRPEIEQAVKSRDLDARTWANKFLDQRREGEQRT